MKYIMIFLCLFILLSSNSFGQCVDDNDCISGGLCINGQCAEPESPSAVKQKKKSDSDELGVFDFWVNPMGFILFGPSVGLEFRIAPSTYLMGSYRAAGIDVVFNTILKATNDEDILASSTGLGLGVKHFFKMGRSGHLFYIGGGIEYLILNSQIDRGIYDMWDNYSSDRLVNKKTRGVSILTHDGFRFRFGERKKFLFNVGLSFGVYIETYFERRWDDDNSLNANEEADWYNREVLPVGALELSIGFGM